MASTGWITAGTGLSNSPTAAGGSKPWTGASNITVANDAAGAYCNPSAAATWYSYSLRSYNYGFSIPQNSQIDGIQARIRRQASIAAYGSVQTYRTRLVVAGPDMIGTNKSTSDTWSSTIHTLTYGGTTDTWNAGLTVDDINTSSFGFMTQFYAYTGTYPYALVYNMQMNISCTELPSGQMTIF